MLEIWSKLRIEISELIAAALSSLLINDHRLCQRIFYVRMGTNSRRNDWLNLWKNWDFNFNLNLIDSLETTLLTNIKWPQCGQYTLMRANTYVHIWYGWYD